MSAAFSAIITTAALVLPPTMLGNTEASATRSASHAVHAQLRIHNGVRIRPHAAELQG